MLRIYFIPILCLAVSISGCYDAGTPAASGGKKKSKPFEFKETIVTGKDTGMKSLSRFHKSDIADVLCQHWGSEEFGDYLPKDLPGELWMFKDSSVLEKPRGHMRTGRWRVVVIDRHPILELHFQANKKEQYLIGQIEWNKLKLVDIHRREILPIKLISDGLVHQNMYNDPFHPINNQWRIPPPKPESDSAIKSRVKQCVRFYALYYRDNIRREKKEISFIGLPTIFEWYHRGIGLPDRAEVDDSWVHCFYDRAQALKGYDILRKLIVDYEFNWPQKAPSWVHETHSVLEQMYHKL
jgi:hypothetical protein